MPDLQVCKVCFSSPARFSSFAESVIDESVGFRRFFINERRVIRYGVNLRVLLCFVDVLG